MICKAQTKSGKKCKNGRYKNSDYCYIHSLTNNNKLTVLQNPITHFTLTFGAIALAIYFYFSGPTLNNQVTMIDKQNSTAQVTAEIRDILKNELKEVHNKYQDYFLKSYPLGYQLLAFDKYSTVIPFNSILNINYKIDWSTSILKDLGDGFEITIPDGISKDYHTSFSRNTCVTDKGKFSPTSVLSIDGLGVFVEVIDYNYYGYIILIGFKSIRKEKI